jgi:DHA2 family multidrug resistance protein-like MFS transporter
VVLNALMFGLVFLGVDGLGVRIEAVPGGAPAGSLWLPLAELAAGIVIGVIYVRRQLASPCRCFRWICCASPCSRCPWARR